MLEVHVFSLYKDNQHYVRLFFFFSVLLLLVRKREEEEEEEEEDERTVGTARRAKVVEHC